MNIVCVSPCSPPQSQGGRGQEDRVGVQQEAEGPPTVCSCQQGTGYLGEGQSRLSNGHSHCVFVAKINKETKVRIFMSKRHSSG